LALGGGPVGPVGGSGPGEARRPVGLDKAFSVGYACSQGRVLKRVELGGVTLRGGFGRGRSGGVSSARESSSSYSAYSLVGVVVVPPSPSFPGVFAVSPEKKHFLNDHRLYLRVSDAGPARLPPFRGRRQARTGGCRRLSISW
jgi:hypothetical protein